VPTMARLTTDHSLTGADVQRAGPGSRCSSNGSTTAVALLPSFVVVISAPACPTRKKEDRIESVGLHLMFL